MAGVKERVVAFADSSLQKGLGSGRVDLEVIQINQEAVMGKEKERKEERKKLRKNKIKRESMDNKNKGQKEEWTENMKSLKVYAIKYENFYFSN